MPKPYANSPNLLLPTLVARACVSLLASSSSNYTEMASQGVIYRATPGNSRCPNSQQKLLSLNRAMT
jgi:hypothetical protein